MIHVMYICLPSRHGFMTSLQWRCNSNNNNKKKSQPTRNENEPKQHKSRKQAFSNIFLKRSFLFFCLFFFYYMSSSSCACRIMKLQRSFRRKANRPLVAALGAVRARPERSFPGQDPCSTWGDGDVGFETCNGWATGMPKVQPTVH